MRQSYLCSYTADSCLNPQPYSATAVSPGSAYDDYPPPDVGAPNSAAPQRNRASEDRGTDSGYAGSSPAPARRPSEDYNASNRRRPSQDTTGRRSSEREYGRRPSESASVHSDSTSTTNAQSATAGMGMIIPNKSTIAEEDIEVPYGRELRDSTGTAVDDREKSLDKSREDTDGDDDPSPLSPGGLGGLSGLSGLSARLKAVDDDDDGQSGAGARSGDDYFDKLSYGRASVASDRSAGGAIGSRLMNGRMSVGGEDGEKIRRDYEFRIATMQTRIATIERDLEDAQLREQKWAESEERVRTMEAELEELRQVN